jgi:hypothetical protein
MVTGTNGKENTVFTVLDDLEGHLHGQLTLPSAHRFLIGTSLLHHENYLWIACLTYEFLIPQRTQDMVSSNGVPDYPWSGTQFLSGPSSWTKVVFHIVCILCCRWYSFALEY